MTGNLLAIDLLLDSGVDVNKPVKGLVSRPLALAVMNDQSSQPQAIEPLISRGASPDVMKGRENLLGVACRLGKCSANLHQPIASRPAIRSLSDLCQIFYTS